MEYGHPRGNVFYRKMARNYPCIVRGEGIYLYDENGKRFIDGSGGAIVVNLGHGQKESCPGSDGTDGEGRVRSRDPIHDPGDGRIRRSPWRSSSPGDRQDLLPVRRLGGGRSGRQDGPAIPGRFGGSPALARRFPVEQLSRQHPRGPFPDRAHRLPETLSPLVDQLSPFPAPLLLPLPLWP